MPQYQGVWTLPQQAQAQSNQQWVTDPNFKNTTLLLQADGTGSAQNNTFLDSSTNNFTVTRAGNTTQGSFSPFSQVDGRWGIYLDGSSNLVVSSNAVAATGAFTIEAWVYITTNTGSGSQGIYTQYTGANAGRMQFLFSDTDKKFQFAIANTVYATTSAYPFVYNTWVHVVVSRDSSNNLTFYVNGVRDSVTAGVSTSLYTLSPTIGNRSGGGVPFYGYISNLRITSTSVYSGTSFAVPDFPLLTVTGTTLLTCQSNRFVDNNTATTAKTFTTSGTPTVQAFGPFAPQYQYTTPVVGGAGYFDGTGDYLTVPDNAVFDFGSGNFTIETWINPTSLPQTGFVLAKRPTGTAYGPFVLGFNASSSITIFCSTSGSAWNIQITSSIATPAGSWSHVAFTRNGSTFTLWVNGQSAGTGTNASALTVNSTVVTVGVGAANLTDLYAGSISSLRIVKGTAVYTTAFTPPTAPPTAITNTQLLLNYTNAAIYDGRTANNFETVGNAQVSAVIVKYGSGSMYFPTSSGDYLASFNNPIMGIGDCTIEAWVYPLFNNASIYGVYVTGPGGTANNLRFGLYTNQLYVDVLGAGVISLTGPTILPNVWTHIATTRANGVWRGFVNGILITSTTSQGTASITGTERYVGTLGPTGGGTTGFNGYIDDLRVTQGVARYIANFTPPKVALPRQ